LDAQNQLARAQTSNLDLAPRNLVPLVRLLDREILDFLGLHLDGQTNQLVLLAQVDVVVLDTWSLPSRHLAMAR
jgi:hypothetical protein